MRPREARKICRAVCAVLLPLPALLVSCEEPERGPVFLAEDTRIELGLGGAHVENEWNTLFIEVKNRGTTFDGVIEVAGDLSPMGGALGEPDPITYRTRIEIPEGETRRLAVPVRTRTWNRVTLRYEQEGGEDRRRFDLQHVFELAPARSVATRVLAVGNGLRDFGSLAKAIEDSHHPTPPNSPLPPVESRCEVTRLVPASLPPHWAAYHPFQMVLLHDTMLLDAPLGAVEGLASWVARGGSLVVFPGPASASGVPPALGELLNAKAGDPRSAPPEHLLRDLASGDVTGYFRPWEPGPGAAMTELGLAVVSRHGAGTVTTFSFTPAGGTFPAPGDAPGLYSDLAPAIVRSRGAAGNPGPALSTMESQIASRLFDMTSFKTPAGVVIALGLGVYAIFGFFLPHHFFKRRRRRELTFAFGVIAAALATGAVYRYGVLNIGDRAEVVEINVVRLHRGGPGAEVTSFVGLLSPRRASFQLLAETSGPQPIGSFARSAGPLSGDLFADYRMQRLRTPPTTIEFDRRGRVRLEKIALGPNAIRCFRVDDRIESQELVAVRFARTDDGRVSAVLVRNDGERPLFGMVIDGWECASLGWLPPGNERDCLSIPADSRMDLDALQLAWMHQALPFLSAGSGFPVRWMEDSRKDIVKPIILGLIHEARGLGSSTYAWQALMPGNPAANRQSGLKEELRRHEPRILLLVGDEPVFQPGEPVPERRALTCIVLELPSAAESA